MGGQLVKKAYAVMFLAAQNGAAFSVNEHRILVFMASMAMDDQETPRYWAGRETLASHALNRVVPPEGEDEKQRDSIYKSVSIATRSLIRRGVITKHGSAHPGRNQEYALTVDNPVPLPVKEKPPKEPDVPPSGTSGSTKRNVRFLKEESDVPPETKRPTDPGRNPKSPKPTTSLGAGRAVDNQEAA